MALLFRSRGQETDSGKAKQLTQGVVYRKCSKEPSSESFFAIGRVCSLYIGGRWKGICSLLSVIPVRCCEPRLAVCPRGASCETDHALVYLKQQKTRWLSYRNSLVVCSLSPFLPSELDLRLMNEPPFPLGKP